MTARDIQRRLIFDKRQSHCMPNFTPKIWFECDVIEITKAGFFVEYEIKLSKSDFKADALKNSHHWAFDDSLQKWGYTNRNKHRLLSEHSKDGPSRFFFVCPEGLLSVAEIPAWAGLIYAHETKSHRSPFNIRLTKVKSAEQLHRVKKPDFTQQIERCSYFRFITQFYTAKIK